MAKRTIIQVIIDHFKEKPATVEEIKQLELNLKREEIKAKTKEMKLKHKGGSGIDKLARITNELFAKNEDVKYPRF